MSVILAEHLTVNLSAFMFASLMAYAAQSNLQFLIIDATSPIIGIAFYLIIIRVKLGIGHGYHPDASNPGNRIILFPSVRRNGRDTNGSDGQNMGLHKNSYNLRVPPLAVNITHDVNIMVDYHSDSLVKETSTSGTESFTEIASDLSSA